MKDKGPRLIKGSLSLGLEADHSILKGPRPGCCGGTDFDGERMLVRVGVRKASRLPPF